MDTIYTHDITKIVITRREMRNEYGLQYKTIRVFATKTNGEVIDINFFGDKEREYEIELKIENKTTED